MGSDPGELRHRVASDLRLVLEDLLFNLEHGIPWRVVHELERVADDLGRLEGVEPPLEAEIAGFRTGVNELFASHGAAEEVLFHGERVAAMLRG